MLHPGQTERLSDPEAGVGRRYELAAPDQSNTHGADGGPEDGVAGRRGSRQDNSAHCPPRIGVRFRPSPSPRFQVSEQPVLHNCDHGCNTDGMSRDVRLLVGGQAVRARSGWRGCPPTWRQRPGGHAGACDAGGRGRQHLDVIRAMRRVGYFSQGARGALSSVIEKSNHLVDTRTCR